MPRLSRMWRAAFCVGLLGAWCATAQEPATDPNASPPETAPVETAASPAAESQPATLPATSTLLNVEEVGTARITAEEINARVAQIDANTELDEKTKNTLRTLYRQALEQLQVADTWTQKAAEFAASLQDTPDLLVKTRERLALTTQPTSQPTSQPANDATLTALTAELTQRETALQEARSVADQLKATANNRQMRDEQLPKLLAELRTRLTGIQSELAAPAGDTAPRTALANRALLLARKHASEQELEAYQQEQHFNEGRRELLNLRQELARQEVNRAATTVDAWRQAVDAKRAAEARAQEAQARHELASVPEPIKALAEQNKTLTEEFSRLTTQIRSTQTRAKEMASTQTTLAARLDELEQKVKAPVSSAYVGAELWHARSELQDYETLQQEKRKDDAELYRAQLRSSELYDAREAINAGDVDDELANALAIAPDADQAELRNRIIDLLTRRTELLDQLIRDYRAYKNELYGLVNAEEGLLDRVNELERFISAHVLWMRSAGPLYQATWPNDTTAVLRRVGAVGQALLTDIMTAPPFYIINVLLLSILLFIQRRAQRTLLSIRDRVFHVYTDKFALTLQAFVCTALLAVPWPLFVWLIGWRVGQIPSSAPAPLESVVGHALQVAARLWLSLNIVRQLCRSRGIFESHFRWYAAGAKLARQHLTWLTMVLVPLGALVIIVEGLREDTWSNSIGRVLFLIIVAALTVFTQRLIRPTGGIFESQLKRRRDGAVYRLRYAWYLGLLAIPVALGIATIVGYHYSALQLTGRIVRTVWVVLGILVAHGVLVRWLFVVQRKLALAQARKRRAAQIEAAAKAEQMEAGAEPPPPIDESEFDLVTVGDQARTLLRTLVVLALIAGMWLTWSDLLPALNWMNQVQLWSYHTTVTADDGSTESITEYITLAHVGLALVIAFVTYVLTRNIPGLLEITILNRLPIDAGGRFAVTAIARYVIVTIGVIVAFSAIGVGWSKVQWLIAAISVGLGFGLQEIFANFVSGLVLLFERPIRIGDTVTIGETSGTVTRIRIRATTITDWDRKELIIPNKEFITGQVVNWTLSDSILRLTVPVGLAYGSDTDKAEEILYRIANETPNVLKEPQPRVLFLEFGDNSLNYEVRVYIPSVDFTLDVKHRMHRAIDDAFRAAGIEIAFPQVDLHVRTIDAGVRLPIEHSPPHDPSKSQSQGQQESGR